MKKLLVFIALIVIFLSGNKAETFTLTDYFDGEYSSYTKNPINNSSINLGCCYLNPSVSTDNIVGESIVVQDLEISTAINNLNAKIILTEILDDETLVIYAYSDKINKHVEVDNHKVNVQIAEKQGFSIIGWPLILGSF